MSGRVLIISSADDMSTNDVIDWLVKYRVPFLRVNDDMPL